MQPPASDPAASDPVATGAFVVGRRGVHRRPSGEPAPLPKAAWWPRAVATLIVVVVVGAVIAAAQAVDPPTSTWFTSPDPNSAATSIAKVCNVLATVSGIIVLRLVLAVALAWFRRFRHLVVAIFAMWLTDTLVTAIHQELPPPSSWIVAPASGSWFFPASAIASLAITLAVMAMALAPAGRTRRRAMAAAIGVAVLVVLARAYLGATYPLAGLYSTLIGFTTAAVVFGWLAPDEAFPVSYRRGGNAAHLDLEGARAQAVRDAMRDQLGLQVTDLRPFGNEGSGGSTPLLMTLDDGSKVFGKIIATSHVRSDRWYRVIRTIMYGRLEDETKFTSVRRLIQQEDYALRLLDDVGITVAHSYGIVELTPNREYMLVEQFFDGADTLARAEVNDEIIAEGMQLIRTLWDAGLAHRDIKPANLLVVDGHLQLIDVSGLEVRPTPWRQAVDLANMMLVMALRTDPERVYEIAQRFFTPDDIGEAFAAARGMAIPTESQRFLKEDHRDLVARFRELAPPHPKISIQRWSARRVGLTIGVVLGSILMVLWSLTVFLEVID
jgi:membrane-associated phospholipid phosphatase/tRNA A-37 threonylcarbamoyl transferase component Bud32